MAWIPLFRTDPNRFGTLIFGTSPLEDRLQVYSTYPDMLMGEIVRYGATNDADTIPNLMSLYDYILRQNVLAEIRREVYQEVLGFVSNVSWVSANAFLPFIMMDPDRGIASTATIDYVSMALLTDGDPMSRPKDMLQAIERQQPANVGAVFGALLNLGDPSVCRLLWNVRNLLTETEVNEAVGCSTGLLSQATVEFYLSWLEGMDGDRDDGLFGSVASGLALVRRHATMPLVMTGQRPFPVASVSPQEQHAMAKFVSLDEFTVRIAPRLYALERTEGKPKVMDVVLQIWGLSSATGPSAPSGCAIS